MKVVSEILTVLPGRERREVEVIMAGLRITLEAEEAQLLAQSVLQALGQIGAPASAAQVAPASAPLRIASNEAKPEKSEDEPAIDPRFAGIAFSGIRNLVR